MKKRRFRGGEGAIEGWNRRREQGETMRSFVRKFSATCDARVFYWRLGFRNCAVGRRNFGPMQGFGYCHRNSPLLRSLIVAAAIGAGLYSGVAVAREAKLAWLFDFAPNYADSSEPYEFRMGDNSFKVPRRYITSNQLPPSGSRLDGGVIFTLLWPGLEPIDEDNKGFFSAPGGVRRVLILLIPKREFRLGPDLLQLYRGHASREAKYVNEFGYEVYEMLTGFKSNELFLRIENGVERFFLCDEIIESPIPRFPRCEAHIYFERDLRITYSFNRRFIGDSGMIRESLVSLFESFRSYMPNSPDRKEVK